MFERLTAAAGVLFGKLPVPACDMHQVDPEGRQCRGHLASGRLYARGSLMLSACPTHHDLLVAEFERIDWTDRPAITIGGAEVLSERPSAS